MIRNEVFENDFRYLGKAHVCKSPEKHGAHGDIVICDICFQMWHFSKGLGDSLFVCEPGWYKFTGDVEYAWDPCMDDVGDGV